jgi:hypothetical protein
MVPVELDAMAVEETDEEAWVEDEPWASPPAPPPPVDCGSSPLQPANRAAERAPEKSAPSAYRDLITNLLKMVIEWEKLARGPALSGKHPPGLRPPR